MRLSPETPVSVKPKQEIRLTSAALGYDLNNPLGRTSIKLSYAEDHGDELDTEAGKSETFLCSLIGGYVRNSSQLSMQREIDILSIRLSNRQSLK